MMKNMCYRLRWLLVLACVLACQGCTRQPTIEELSEFIGKTEEELQEKFGPPWSIGYVRTADFYLSPEDQDNEDKVKEQYEWREETTKRTLVYGKLRVDVNFHDRIVRVRHADK